MNSIRFFCTPRYLLLLAAAFGLSACETTESGKEIDPKSAPVEIQKGMTAEDLVAAIGEPDEVREATPPVEGTEIWVYQKVDESVSLVLSGTTQTPGMDIGGVQMTITDNVYTPSTSRYVEETQFLMVDGIMIAWKVRKNENTRLN